MQITIHSRLGHFARAQLTKPLTVGVALFGLSSTGCPPVTPRTPPPTIGEPMQEIDEAYLTGIGPRSLAEARGMVVVLEFWATYCEPCKRSFPAYQELHEAGGVAVISVALDEPSDVAEKDVKQFADDTGATFAVLWDKDQSSIDQYGLRKMPTAFVIDQKGVLRHIHGGYEAGTMDLLKREIAALLGPGAPAPKAPSPAPTETPSAAPAEAPSTAPEARETAPDSGEPTPE